MLRYLMYRVALKALKSLSAGFHLPFHPPRAKWNPTDNLDSGQRLGVPESYRLTREELRREPVAESATYFTWIDGTCINQKDIPEQSQQLLAMRNIYGDSANLIVWLGPESDRSRKLIEIMKKLRDAGNPIDSELRRKSCLVMGLKA